MTMPSTPASTKAAAAAPKRGQLAGGQFEAGVLPNHYTKRQRRGGAMASNDGNEGSQPAVDRWPHDLEPIGAALGGGTGVRSGLDDDFENGHDVTDCQLISYRCQLNSA